MGFLDLMSKGLMSSLGSDEDADVTTDGVNNPLASGED
jgi:hypothetical protein